MPIFKYKARNEYGENVIGKVEAKNEGQAAKVLMGRNLLVINIRPIAEGTLANIFSSVFGVSTDDLVRFTRQLSTMINAGLPLSNALTILQNQSNPAMASVVTKLLKDVEGGSSFAEALAEQPDVFPRVFIQLVKAGEIGGVLDEVLQRMAQNLEKQKDFREKTKSAMIYPVIVVIAMAIVAFIMMVFVMPKLTQMYADFEAELPLPTKILITMSNFAANYWWIVILAVIGTVFGIRTWVQTEFGEKKVDEYLLKIPLFGPLRKKIVLAEFSRTLSLLIASGVPLLEALDIVAKTLNSVNFRSIFLEAKDEVKKGASLSQAIGVYEILPPILSQMISVGEETGRIDEILNKLSEYYERESEYAVKNLTSAMEPAIMIVLGLGVGVMVIAIIMPIYNLTAQF